MLTCRKLLQKLYEEIKRYEDIFPRSVGDKVGCIETVNIIYEFEKESEETCKNISIGRIGNR